jgi:SAM-dependent methyltransferase
MKQPHKTHELVDWERNAGRYAQAIGTADDRIYPQFKAVMWECLGDLTSRTVLDLGCGHGWLSQELHQAGAAVTGIDGSAALLEAAKQSYADVAFIQHDLTRGLPPLEHPFDRVVSHMVLMDLPVLDPLLRDLRRVLKPDGRFIFTLPHPCFFNRKVRRDEATGQPFRAVTGYHKEEVWRIEHFGGHNHYHRSLTFYAERLRQHGFAITRLYEPEHIPGTDDDLTDFYRSIPVFILFEAMPVSR